jgi:mersacidin/lichenicidin family type 2 lantibiotic
MANIDIARALKDRNYFNSLSDEEKAMVRQANPAGDHNLNESDLDSVAGGLGGGEETDATTTTTEGQCTCPGVVAPADATQSAAGCACGC